MKKYPTFRIDVYPTHRSVGFPDWVIAGTKKAAIRATTTDDGLVLKDGQGGIPFPIPKSGYEAMWNNMTSYVANPIAELESWYVDSSGKPVMVDKGIASWDFSGQWDPKFSGRNDYYTGVFKWLTTAPPRRSGLAFSGQGSGQLGKNGETLLALPARTTSRQARVGNQLRHAEFRCGRDQ